MERKSTPKGEKGLAVIMYFIAAVWLIMFVTLSIYQRDNKQEAITLAVMGAAPVIAMAVGWLKGRRADRRTARREAEHLIQSPKEPLKATESKSKTGCLFFFAAVAGPLLCVLIAVIVVMGIDSLLSEEFVVWTIVLSPIAYIILLCTLASNDDKKM